MAVVDVPKVKIETYRAASLPRVRRGERDLAARRPAGGDPRGRGRVPGPLRDPGEPGRARCARSTSPRPATRSSSPSAAPPRAPNPYINIINRLQVVQFEDFDGRLRTLAYEPTVPEGPAEAPYYAQQIEKLGEFLSYKVLATIWNHPDEALAKAGLRPEDVDYVSFDHLHVQDLRFVLGTTEPIDGRGGAAPAAVPEREADRPAQGVGHLRLAAPDAVGLVRRGRDQGPDHRQRRPGRRRRRARQGRGARLDAGPHRRQPLALHQHPRRRLGLVRERRRRRHLAPAPVEDPRRPQDRRVLRPRGDPQLEHARGLDRPVRLDDQGEGAGRPEPARPALR